jgi:NitT/TauT family transport system permease protein
MTIGAAVGLVLGSVRILADIFRPFVVALNAIPKIALIPIVVLLFGPTFKGTMSTAIMTTFIVTFFNAFAGARSVTPQLVQNATLLGASPVQVMLRIRLPYVIAWTLAVLPLLATFSVIAVVTAELLIGYPGLGRLILEATTTADATLTFSVVLILTIVGVTVVGVAGLISKRVLHWWGK